MKAWGWLLLGALASVLSWTYMHRILLPWTHYVNVEHGWLKAQLGDLYPRWVGTQELLLHGTNPYSAEVSHKIQIAFYGQILQQSYDKPQHEIIDEQRFAYPVYVVFLFAPTVHVDFEVLQRWVPIVLGALTVVSVWLWMSVIRWRPPSWKPLAIGLLVLSSPQIAQGMRLRQLGLLVAFLLALGTWCITHNRLFLAGALFAAATIKPQMVALCLLWFLIWTLGDWKKRWPLAAGFTATLGLLAGAGEILVSGWMRYFLEGMEAYRHYFPLGATSIVRFTLGNWVGGILSGMVMIVLLIYAWNRRQTTAESTEFARVLSFFFVTGALVLPLMTPYNQVLLLLPLMMLIRDWEHLPRWDRVGFALFMAWPFVTAAALLMFPPPLDSHRTALLPSELLPLAPFLFFWVTFTLSRRQASGVAVLNSGMLDRSVS